MHPKSFSLTTNFSKDEASRKRRESDKGHALILLSVKNKQRPTWKFHTRLTLPYITAIRACDITHFIYNLFPDALSVSLFYLCMSECTFASRCMKKVSILKSWKVNKSVEVLARGFLWDKSTMEKGASKLFYIKESTAAHIVPASR